MNASDTKAQEIGAAGAAEASTAPVSLRHKIAYATGAVSDMIGYHGPVTLINPIFNIVLGVSPTLIGVAKGICRVWDAFTDPVMGAISDRGLGRYGRRRPFIIVGALAMGLSFFALFNVPRGMGAWTTFVFMTVLLLLFYSAFTVFTVPFHALGYELASDTNDRTRVMAWRLVFNMVGNILVSWLFTATQSPIFRDSLEGVYYVGAATGLVIIACGIVPGLLVPEKRQAVAHRTVSTIGALRTVWHNRPFIRLVVLALLQIGTGTVAVMLGEYVNFYHVFHGDLKAAAIVSSTGATIGYVCSLASAFLWTRLSTRYEKRNVLIGAIAAFALLSASAWWLFTPAHPQLQIVYRVLYPPVVFGFWLMVQSMIADACAFEEWRGGARRDAVMGACITWSQKMGVSAAFILGGLVLDWSGFQAKLGAAQPPQALVIMRIAMVALPVAGMLIAVKVARGCVLTRAEMKRIAAELEVRRDVATAGGSSPTA